jgi:hypothetical protein
MAYCTTLYVTVLVTFQILVLLPEDGGRLPKLVGEGTTVLLCLLRICKYLVS